MVTNNIKIIIFSMMILLVMPFVVYAGNLNELAFKWAEDTTVSEWDEVTSYPVEDGILSVFYNKIEKYDRQGGYVKSYTLDGEYFFASKFDNDLVVGTYDSSKSTIKFVLLDKNLNLIKKNEVSSSLLRFSYGSYAYENSYVVTEENNKLIVDNHNFDNNYFTHFTLDRELNFANTDTTSDGGYIWYSNNQIIRYDKDGNVVKSINACSQNFKIAKFGNKYLIYRECPYLSADYGFTIDVFDEDLTHLTEVAKVNLMNPGGRGGGDLSDNEIYEQFYNSSIFEYNGNVYINGEYTLDDNYKLIKCSDDDPLFTTTYLGALNKLKSEYSSNFSDYDYAIDGDGNIIIYAALREQTTMLHMYDKNLNLVFTDEIDASYASPIYYPCINYSNKYIAVAFRNRSTNQENVIFYDKKGNKLHTLVLDDYGATSLPCINVMTDNSIGIVLYNEDYYSTAAKVVYYEMPYDIFVKTDGNGKVTANREKAAYGEVVRFTIEPKEGYVLGVVKVTDATGKVVTFTDYTFTMPSADVTIEVSFVPENPNTKDIAIISCIALIIIGVSLVIINMRKARWISK